MSRGLLVTSPQSLSSLTSHLSIWCSKPLTWNTSYLAFTGLPSAHFSNPQMEAVSKVLIPILSHSFPSLVISSISMTSTTIYVDDSCLSPVLTSPPDFPWACKIISHWCLSDTSTSMGLKLSWSFFLSKLFLPASSKLGSSAIPSFPSIGHYIAYGGASSSSYP